MKIYQITELDVDEPLIFIGNENAVLDFVNKNSSDAYDFIEDIDEAIEWLKDHEYEIKEIKNLINRLEKGKMICVKQEV